MTFILKRLKRKLVHMCFSVLSNKTRALKAQTIDASSNVKQVTLNDLSGQINYYMRILSHYWTALIYQI